MAGAWTTKDIKDAGDNIVTMRVWDESGVNTGPFVFGHMLTSGAGAGVNPATEGTIASLAKEDGGVLDDISQSMSVVQTDLDILATGSISPGSEVSPSEDFLSFHGFPQGVGGCDVFRTVDLDQTPQAISGVAGNVYGVNIFNLVASIRYVRLYNLAAGSVTVGSTPTKELIGVPASQPVFLSFAHPIHFDTAIAIAATTGFADADTGAPGANDLLASVYYK